MGENDDGLRGIARYEIQKRVGDGTYGYVNLVRSKVRSLFLFLFLFASLPQGVMHREGTLWLVARTI